MKLRVLIRGCADTLTGYGQDIHGLILTLLEMGVEVDFWPTRITPPVSEPVAQLMTRKLNPPYDLLLYYCPPSEVTPWEMPGWGDRVIAWSMAEWTPLRTADLGSKWYDADDPDMAAGRVWSRRLRWDPAGPKMWLDAMVVTCPMNVDAFSAVDPHLRYEVITPGLRLEDWPVLDRERDEGAPVVFGCEGVLAGRKDPGALFRAWDGFRAAYPGLPARLELHVAGNPRECLARAAAREPGDVIVHSEAWSHRQMLEWYRGIDCWVSTSRGEGVNKPAVQALATGIPVIAAAWGGHETWLHPSHGYLAGYREVVEEVEAPGPPATRVQVDTASVAELMGEAALDAAERRRRGAAGARFVRSALGWERQAGELLRLVGAL